MYDQYSFQVIPVMGQLIAGQWKPYQYLVESIRQFPNQVRGLYVAGFKIFTIARIQVMVLLVVI
jgi:2-methoxy-6-polyprenyl-1,4-benzoquinol methylase